MSIYQEGNKYFLQKVDVLCKSCLLFQSCGRILPIEMELLK